MHNIFVETFGKIPDPRINRTKKHLLTDIIGLTLFAIMAGAQTFDEIEMFGTVHKVFLEQYLQFPNGVPSHDTINRVLSLLDPKLLEEAFIEWHKQLKGHVKHTVVAIDGKTMKASHQNSKGIKALHVLSAYSCANGLSLGQLRVDGKTNEITVIPELLEQLAIEGAIITIDAMGCQKDIAAAIVKKKSDYILAVKGNQKELYEPIKEMFKVGDEFGAKTYTHEVNGDHGRIERRHVMSLPVKLLESQFDIDKWANIQSIIEVTYETDTSTEKRYFISTLPYEKVEYIAHSIRSHWQIENNLHWVLDVVFKEDDSRIRDERTAINFAWFRKMAIAFLAKDGTNMSMKKKMYRNAMQLRVLLKGW